MPTNKYQSNTSITEITADSFIKILTHLQLRGYDVPITVRRSTGDGYHTFVDLIVISFSITLFLLYHSLGDKIGCSCTRRNNNLLLYGTARGKESRLTHTLFYFADSGITTILISLRDTCAFLFTLRNIGVHSVSEVIHWQGSERTRA